MNTNVIHACFDPSGMHVLTVNEAVETRLIDVQKKLYYGTEPPLSLREALHQGFAFNSCQKMTLNQLLKCDYYEVGPDINPELPCFMLHFPNVRYPLSLGQAAKTRLLDLSNSYLIDPANGHFWDMPQALNAGIFDARTGSLLWHDTWIDLAEAVELGLFDTDYLPKDLQSLSETSSPLLKREVLFPQCYMYFNIMLCQVVYQSKRQDRSPQLAMPKESIKGSNHSVSSLPPMFGNTSCTYSNDHGDTFSMGGITERRTRTISFFNSLRRLGTGRRFNAPPPEEQDNCSDVGSLEPDHPQWARVTRKRQRNCVVYAFYYRDENNVRVESVITNSMLEAGWIDTRRRLICDPRDKTYITPGQALLRGCIFAIVFSKVQLLPDTSSDLDPATVYWLELFHRRHEIYQIRMVYDPETSRSVPIEQAIEQGLINPSGAAGAGADAGGASDRGFDSRRASGLRHAAGRVGAEHEHRGTGALLGCVEARSSLPPIAGGGQTGELLLLNHSFFSSACIVNGISVNFALAKFGVDWLQCENYSPSSKPVPKDALSSHFNDRLSRPVQLDTGDYVLAANLPLVRFLELPAHLQQVTESNVEGITLREAIDRGWIDALNGKLVMMDQGQARRTVVNLLEAVDTDIINADKIFVKPLDDDDYSHHRLSAILQEVDNLNDETLPDNWRSSLIRNLCDEALEGDDTETLILANQLTSKSKQKIKSMMLPTICELPFEDEPGLNLRLGTAIDQGRLLINEGRFLTLKGHRLTLTEAVKRGELDANEILRDPLNNRNEPLCRIAPAMDESLQYRRQVIQAYLVDEEPELVTLKQAIEQGLIQNGKLQTRRGYMNLTQAIANGMLDLQKSLVKYQGNAHYETLRQLITRVPEPMLLDFDHLLQFPLADLVPVSRKLVEAKIARGAALSVQELQELELFDLRNLRVRHPTSNVHVSLDQAVELGLVSLANSAVDNYLSDETGYVPMDDCDPRDLAHLLEEYNWYTLDRIPDNLLEPLQFIDNTLLNKIPADKTVQVDTMPDPVQLIEVLTGTSTDKPSYTLAKALEENLIDPKQGTMMDPHSGQTMTIQDAVVTGLIDADNSLLNSKNGPMTLTHVIGDFGDSISGAEIIDLSQPASSTFKNSSIEAEEERPSPKSFQEFIDGGLYDRNEKCIIDPKSGRQLDLKAAIAEGIISLDRTVFQLSPGNTCTLAVLLEDFGEGVNFADLERLHSPRVEEIPVRKEEDMWDLPDDYLNFGDDDDDATDEDVVQDFSPQSSSPKIDRIQDSIEFPLGPGYQSRLAKEDSESASDSSSSITVINATYPDSLEELIRTNVIHVGEGGSFVRTADGNKVDLDQLIAQKVLDPELTTLKEPVSGQEFTLKQYLDDFGHGAGHRKIVEMMKSDKPMESDERLRSSLPSYMIRGLQQGTYKSMDSGKFLNTATASIRSFESFVQEPESPPDPEQQLQQLIDSGHLRKMGDGTFMNMRTGQSVSQTELDALLGTATVAPNLVESSRQSS
ncbi:hypothetical protein Ciccas_009750, partial [Cichlidogyrus casuarinus]